MIIQFVAPPVSWFKSSPRSIPHDPWYHLGIPKRKQHVAKKRTTTTTTTTTTRFRPSHLPHHLLQQFQGITSFAAISLAQKSQSSQLGALERWVGFWGVGMIRDECFK